MSNSFRKKQRISGETGFALAFFVGGFSLLNILGEIRFEGFDANYWWIDFGSLSGIVSNVILVTTSVLLFGFAFGRRLPAKLLIFLRVLLAFLIFVCICNSIMFFIFVKNKVISSEFILPFSLIIASGLVIIFTATFKKCPEQRKFREWSAFFCWVVIFMFGFPLCQLFCFGKTDYRRKADAVVVFGARAYADGTMSHALRDRTVTGCNLLLGGFADKIIFSGGPGDGSIHETEAMKRKAVEMGIAEQAVILDKSGLNTRHTVINTAKIFDEQSINRVLVVSHFYHMPRIKMTYKRRGCQVFTVPAKESYLLKAMPMYILREVAALWKYYLTPLVP